ncbi:hypothetical protein EVAR_74314_1 [Eumeta japonica]|uniref:Uncharacterized protein n=1 Tax=Eumeta variegata TaxID=151549 RepID=A0A4C1SCQ4_EUMVA|nr:hypothetical protein EVAR_74314_1 [Eumeta japonica]
MCADRVKVVNTASYSNAVELEEGEKGPSTAVCAVMRPRRARLPAFTAVYNPSVNNRYPTPFQEAGDALITPLGLRVSMGADSNQVPFGLRTTPSIMRHGGFYSISIWQGALLAPNNKIWLRLMHLHILNKNMVRPQEMRSLRSMCRVSRKDRRRNSDVRERCNLKEDVVSKVERGILRFGHLEKMNEDRLTKQIYRANVCDGKVGKDRPGKSYADQILGTQN